ncbi:MAG: phospho-N-acetylmuramoyl-pentapeptide-transferase, partial [Clostridia bacterium]|nr:phospho-N-acetylmuramoyl-pentapeptide-transferase [Clostridia bacterium]
LANEYKNLSYFCVTIFAGMLAFLLFNVFPAKVFMGDTGSLALGGAAASVAVLSKNTLFIPVVGFVFVLSVVSVVLQVVRYKISKKRFFLMAPYHHHLQMKGHSEPRIVCFYSVATILLGFLAVAFG